MRVLRLSSVYEPPPRCLRGPGAALDPVGGMQSHTGALTRALDRAGVRQDVVTAYRPGARMREVVGERATVWRVGLPVRRARQLWAPPAAVLAPALARRADLVHAHLGEDLAVLPIARAAAAVARVPLVLTLHMSLAHTIADAPCPDRLLRLQRRFGAALERHVSASADGVLVLTRRMRALLAEAGLDPWRLWVVPSGVPAELFDLDRPDPMPQARRPRVVLVGRLAAQKDPLTLVEAAARLRADADVVLVGDGPLRHAVQERVAALGLGDRVHLTGFLPRAEAVTHLAHADVMVLPSRYEELGTALVEAAALGVPVVASRTGGIPEVVQDGVTGLLVEPGDAAGFAAAIDRLLADTGGRRAMAAAARAHGRAYDWDDLARQVLAAYGTVLGAPAPDADPEPLPVS